MRAILLILCVLGFANLSQAQTKEETIKWIKEKLEKYGGGENYGCTNVSVSPCNISFVYESSKNNCEYNFNPSKTKLWTVGSNKDVIYADAKIIQYHYIYFQGQTTDGNKGERADLYIRNGESNIHERMAKALLHLATFCEETKKEAF